MVLDPAEIYDKEFKKEVKFFGYDPKEVDDFLDVIASYYDQLWSEKKQLEEKIANMKQELNKYKSMEDSLEQSIRVGQETMENKKEDAKQKASIIIKEAKVKAEDIVKKAEQKKDSIVERAENKKSKILTEAQQEVEKKYKSLQEIAEKEKLFKIRFRTLLESHLDMLNTEQEDLKQLREKIESIKQED